MNMTETIKTITSRLKYLRVTPRKTRFVADFVRGMPVDEAKAALMFLGRRPSVHVLKLLDSAVANAKNNHKIQKSQLYIKEIKVDQGPKFKRWTPRARGGASPLEKKTSHLTLILGVSDKLAPAKFIFKEKLKKSPPLKGESEKEKAKDQFKESVKETKPVKGPGFFHKVFRRKSI